MPRGDARQTNAAPPSVAPIPANGRKAFESSKYALAVTYWEQVPHPAPELQAALAEACFRAAMNIRELPRAGQRGAYLERAVALFPDDHTYLYHYAMHLHRTGDLDAAEAIYHRLRTEGAPWAGLPELLALVALQRNPHTALSTLGNLGPAVQQQLALVQAWCSPTSPPPLPSKPIKLAHMLHAMQQAATPPDPSPTLPAYAQLNALKVPPMLEPLRQHYLGIAAWQIGNMSLASEHALAALELGPSAPERSYGLLHAVLPIALNELINRAAQVTQAYALSLALRAVAMPDLPLATALTLPPVLDHIAMLAMRERNWEQAIISWTAAHDIIKRNSPKLGSPRLILHNLALAHEAQATHAPPNGEREQAWIATAEQWQALARTRPRSNAKPAPGYDDAAWGWVRRRVVACYRNANRPHEAIKVYRQLVKAEPENLALRLEMVEAMLANDQYGTASNELVRLLQIDPDNIEALLLKTEIEVEYTRSWRTMFQYETLLHLFALNPRDPDLRQRIMHLTFLKVDDLRSVRRNAEAYELLQAAQHFDPKNYTTIIFMAHVLIDTKAHHRVPPLLEQALALSDTDPRAYVQIIECWVLLNELDHARHIWQRALQHIEPEHRLPFHLDLGRVFAAHSAAAQRGMQHVVFGPSFAPHAPPNDELLEMARVAFATAFDADPDNPKLALQIAHDLLLIDPDLALGYARRAEQLAPHDITPLIIIGTILGLQEANREARQVLRQAEKLAREQGDAELAEQAAHIRQMIGTPMLRMSLQMAMRDDTYPDDGFPDEYGDADNPF
ncbi:MAG: tetratricopeptide repeat protein [Chloroflexaceae bacterium]|nr:tetratricopeptide repeat protein [Chloroflexaceae bacterium]